MSTFIGKGSDFILNDDPSAPVTVANVTSVEFSGTKTDTLDSTNFGTSGNTRTFISGLQDAGECTVKGYWHPTETSQTSFLSYWDGDVHDFQVSYPGDIATESFSGVVESFDRTVPLDKEAEFTVKIKLSGASTIA